MYKRNTKMLIGITSSPWDCSCLTEIPVAMYPHSAHAPGAPCHINGRHTLHINGVSWQCVTAAHAPRGTGPQGHLAGAGKVQNVQNILLGNRTGLSQGFSRVCHPPPISRGVGGNCSVYLPNISVNSTKIFEYPLCDELFVIGDSMHFSFKSSVMN